ncbi:MAG: hypothetical protein P3W97_002785 [Tepidimonas sp.]|uniref:hypothetical protein n=1 Tax=Tepidimonas sp. TaxID=2002775 RepID=UPI00259DDD4B|nr:hypothetical protein [Tepidimonas sp.]MDM7456201.1 hypothetical protein [Tepidimonas sp.]
MSRWQQLGHLALATWREGWRSGLWRMLAAVWGLAALAGWFAQETALLEAQAASWAWSAGLARLGDTVALAAAVTYALARAASDRQLEFVAAAPLPRAWWLLGIWLGWQAVALATAALAALVLWPWSEAAAPWAGWAVGHALELMVVVAAGVWFGISLRQGAAALLATVGFVLLARAAPALVLMAQGVGDATAGFWAGAMGVLHALLPDLSRWVPTASAAFEPRVLAEAVLYLGVLYAVAAVDWYRRRLG